MATPDVKVRKIALPLDFTMLTAYKPRYRARIHVSSTNTDGDMVRFSDFWMLWRP